MIVPDSLDPNQGAPVMNLSWLLGPQGDGGGRGRRPRRSAAKNPNQVRLVLSIHTATQGKIPKSKKNRGRSKHAFPIYLFFLMWELTTRKNNLQLRALGADPACLVERETDCCRARRKSWPAADCDHKLDECEPAASRLSRCVRQDSRR